MVFFGPRQERVANLRPGRRPRMPKERMTPQPQPCCLVLSPVRRFGEKALSEMHAADCPVPAFAAMLEEQAYPFSRL